MKQVNTKDGNSNNSNDKEIKLRQFKTKKWNKMESNASIALIGQGKRCGKVLLWF